MHISVVASVLALATAPCFAQSTEGLDATGAETSSNSPVLTLGDLPVPFERSGPVEFTLPTGEVHFYEVVYLPDGGINWAQARILAEEMGGYLVSPRTPEENEFVFSLVEDPKFWHRFDKPDDAFVLSGPFLGAFQVEGSVEPGGGWQWASGEPWDYENWQTADLDIGDLFAPDDQPNDNNGNQNVAAYGEVDYPVPYWTDVPHRMSTLDTPAPPNHGFIVEYETRP